jgi:hypothetical protein
MASSITQAASNGEQGGVIAYSSAEAFFAILKRGVMGSFHHLQRLGCG